MRVCADYLYRKNTIIVILLLFFTLTGCDNSSEEVYDNAVQNGLDALAVEDYKKAEVYFEIALEEKPDNEDVLKLLTQTNAYYSALTHLENGEFNEALKSAEIVVSFDTASNALTLRGQKLIKIINTIYAKTDLYTKEYEEAESQLKNGEYETARDLTRKLLDHEELSEIYYTHFLESVEKLVQTINAQSDDEVTEKAEKEENEEVAATEEIEVMKKDINVETAISDNDSTLSLEGYSMEEIEYARILLMTDSIAPESSTIHVIHNPAGTSVAGGYEDTVKFPNATTFLFGDFVSMGSITYSSHGDGNITIYPVPSHWHQEDQSAEGYRAFAQEILDDAETVYVEPGDNLDIINKINSVTFDYNY